MVRQQCDTFIREKLHQLAKVVEGKYLHAVVGAREWGQIHRPELLERCGLAAEARLAELRDNELLDEFKEACLDLFRAELELYKAHAAAMAEE